MADAAKVAQARALLTKYGAWIDRYASGVPRGVMAAYMAHESGGNPSAPGDASLGELGLFQIAAYVPPLFGYPAAARADSENNVAIAALEYGMEAVKWYLRMPNYVRLGTPDSWMLARLAFAVGRAGSYQLGDLALKSGLVQPGAVYAGILKYVASYGAPALGTQASSKVAARVADIPKQWENGMAADSAGLGPPTLIPAPPAGPYKLPADVASYFVQPIPALLFVLGGAAAILYFLLKRRA